MFIQSIAIILGIVVATATGTVSLDLIDKRNEAVNTLASLNLETDIPWADQMGLHGSYAGDGRPIRRPGMCAILFGSELPCPNNIEASEPSRQTRERLVGICGPAFADGPICCDDGQIDNLESNLKKAENIIASCPACRHNFFEFFCTFTCSADQSTFVDITKTGTSRSKRDIVTELSYYVNNETAAQFYDSCKDVKFSATNGYAMDLIGGGAKIYKDFLKFLGDEKPLLGGSPFQMNFFWDETPDDIIRSVQDMRPCNDSEYKCACTDCPGSCPQLEPIKGGGNVVGPEGQCKIGALPCFSFAVLIVYIAVVCIALGSYGAQELWRKVLSSRYGSVRLLQDDEQVPSGNEYYEDDDERFWARFGRTDFLKSPYRLNSYLQEQFTQLGLLCATFPVTVIATCLVVVGILGMGIWRFGLETDPVGLWVSSSSQEFQEKIFFDENFGPFYRAQQIYVINETGPVLMEYDTVRWWFDIENTITNELGGIQNGDIKYDDVCFKPLGPDSACVVQSVTQYFQGDINRLPESRWQNAIRSCAKSPVNCLPEFQQPLKKEMLFGGYSDETDVLSAKALVVSLVVNNNKIIEPQAEDWEHSLEKYMLDIVIPQAHQRGLRISFSTEMSLEKELNKSSNTDARIIVISYLVMFLYASLALGGVMPLLGYRYLVRSKFSLGLFGIMVVILSVIASVGFFSVWGVKATLIIAEVIPFLVLAIGVDNIFLLTHELESVNLAHPGGSREDRISKAVGQIGPSILLSTFCETITFGLGATVAMPAVRNFAIYSCGAVLANSMLQLTLFVAAMSLDLARAESNRIDCFPCIRAPKPKFVYSESLSVLTARLWGTGMGSSGAATGSPNGNSQTSALMFFEDRDRPSFSKLIGRYYAPVILQGNVKKVIMAVFITWFAFCLALLPRMQFGLDQRLAVPSDSYLVDYFNDLYNYFEAGPPVYFVTHGTNATTRRGQQQLCSRFTTCDEYSVTNVLEQERKRPDISYINEPSSSWIDDFLQWTNPDLEECCRYRKYTNQTEMCSPLASPRNCEVCFADRHWDSQMNGFPKGQEFMKLFSFWIEAPSDPCPLGGKAAHGTAVVPSYSQNTIRSSYFRTSHVPLKSQNDFINAYAAARRIADTIKEKTGVPTFPYSNFYIFFAQYKTIVSDTIGLVGSALAFDFVATMIILGSIQTAFVVVVTVAMIVVSVAGIMVLWDVSLNAVSLVNLVICVGIGVEFCVHIARAFTFAPKINSVGIATVTKQMRATNALVVVGGSVFGGICLTKLIGVSVLAFTSSKIFEVYYFRMWLALIIAASLHSLMFLPVALSYGGGAGYLLDVDQGLASDLAARVYGDDDDDDDMTIY